jgi:hypothetical protein
MGRSRDRLGRMDPSVEGSAISTPGLLNFFRFSTRSVLKRNRKIADSPLGEVDRGSRPALHMRQSEPHHSHGLDQIVFQRAAPIMRT